MFVRIKALKDIIRNGLPLVKEGREADVTQALADDVIEKGEGELVNPYRKPVDLKKLLAPKETKESKK